MVYYPNDKLNQTAENIKRNEFNIMALTGFMIGCVSVFLRFCGIAGALALIISLIGLAEIENGKGGGKYFAITGMILGGFSILYEFFMMLISIII